QSAGVPYAIRIQPLAQHLPVLVGYVKLICERFTPIQLVIEPAFAMRNPAEAPSRHTREFLTLFRDIRRVCEDAGISIALPGTDPTTSANLCSVASDEVALVPGGGLADCGERATHN